MAPFAATLAATLAVGVGVALARAERERRALREHRALDRRFAPRKREPLASGLQRMALGQLDVAIEALTGAGASADSPERRVHEARKALKRLRALVRLLRGELGKRAYRRENRLLRDVGRRLAQARDAAVALETLERLIERHPRKLAKREGVLRLRAKLQSEREGAAELALAEAGKSGGALSQLQAMRLRVSAWQLPDSGGIDLVEPALGRLYVTGRKRMRRAARAKGKDGRGRTRKLHEWRKRVKDLRYAAEMLGVNKLAKGADELGEVLGEEHDLAVLGERVRSEAKASRASGAPDKSSRRQLLKLIAKRRKRLRRRALGDGARLYGRSRKKFLRRTRKKTTLR